MPSKILRRTTYINPKTGQERDDPTANQESRVDMEQYYQPLEQIAGSGLHEWGVASGLSVTATLGSPNVQVLPGIALDATGHHIALAAGAKAEIHPQPVQGVGMVTVSTLVDVATSGATLPTAGQSGEHYLTIQWRETFDEQRWGNSNRTVFEMMHTPWLRLVSVNNFTDDGNRVILAHVILDNAGNVIALSQSGRRGVSLPVEAVHLRLTLKTGDEQPGAPLRIDSGAAAEIRARSDRGLEINTPGMDADGALTWHPRLVIDGGSGHVGIGAMPPVAPLHVHGTSWLQGDTTPLSPNAGKGIGIGFNQGTEVGHIFAYDYSTQTTKDLALNHPGGNVGVGTWQPQAKLHVEGDLRVTGTVQGDLHVEQTVQGGGTTPGWVLGGRVGIWRVHDPSPEDNWLRITTHPTPFPISQVEFGRKADYHDLAVNSFWAAGAWRFDLAEVTPVRAEDELKQGDVVVIDRETGFRVTRSTQPYDRAVYGIVSSYEQAALVIGGYGGPEVATNRTDILPIALVGRVKAKVSTENGLIQVGDLLTTAATPGHLMRCDNPAQHSGAVAGKALEPLANESGMILVLVTLQ